MTLAPDQMRLAPRSNISRKSEPDPGHVGDLVGEYVFKAIDDPAAELEIAGTLPPPPPPLKGAVADVPAPGQVDLVQVFRDHVRSFGPVRSHAETEPQVRRGTGEGNGRVWKRNS